MEKIEDKKYLFWGEKTVSDFSAENISGLYNQGYVFTRIGKGVMHQTRSVRVDLSKFNPSSENRRILKKVEEISLSQKELPLNDYDFKIGKLAKDFYDKKFGGGIMSAQKVKGMLTDKEESNFNLLITYSDAKEILGYSICYKNTEIIHYSYPFYDLEKSPKDMGLGMMTKAIEQAKSSGIKYAYLGSLQRPSDTYKLQFEGLEWFDGKAWQTDLEAVKKILVSARM